MSANAPRLRLLERPEDWSMMPGERAALEGILSEIRPALSIEIGTYRGGSLVPISAQSQTVHAFDRERLPELTAERFPNVTFHVGDSHVLLPRALERFSASGENVDFALVDGDHTAPGARQDVEDLLSSPSVGRTVILLHDTLNERVRAGLEEIDYASFPKVTFVDLDFVPGLVRREGALKDDFWSGLGLVVTGFDLDEEDHWPSVYAVSEVYASFSDVRAKSDEERRIGYEQLLKLDRELAEQKKIVSMMENSLSWRITSPLRTLRQLPRRRAQP
jgi:Methyltransferase domain